MFSSLLYSSDFDFLGYFCIQLNFILLSLKRGYLLARAEDVFILLLWAQVQGVPGPQVVITFELLELRTQEVISIPIRSVGDSWPSSQSWLNLGCDGFLLFVARPRYQSSAWNTHAWFDADFLRGSCGMFLVRIYLVTCMSTQCEKGFSSERNHAYAGTAKTWLGVWLEDLLQSHSFLKRRLGSLNLTLPKVLKWLFWWHSGFCGSLGSEKRLEAI